MGVQWADTGVLRPLGRDGKAPCQRNSNAATILPLSFSTHLWSCGSSCVPYHLPILPPFLCPSPRAVLTHTLTMLIFARVLLGTRVQKEDLLQAGEHAHQENENVDPGRPLPQQGQVHPGALQCRPVLYPHRGRPYAREIVPGERSGRAWVFLCPFECANPLSGVQRQWE